MKQVFPGLLVTLFLFSLISNPGAQELNTNYTVVDTGVTHCYDNHKPISCPGPSEPFFGQDAQYMGNQPNYRDNRDGTITDLNTGLMWQKTPDFVKRSWSNAGKYAQGLDLAGYGDWRLPTIKELFSLADFRGNIRTRTPYIDTSYFDFKYPAVSRFSRIIDAQYWSSNLYGGLAMQNRISAFGFNFADGRIKAYPVSAPRGGAPLARDRRYVRCARGPQYGVNDFKDNGDGTVTDKATGLMWMKRDSPAPMNWRDALAYAENLAHAGYDDWRLPNVKELQTIVDYSRAPDARAGFIKGPAIDPIFELSDPEAWGWSSTSFMEAGGASALYVAFGRAMSAWKYQGKPMNAHGAGAVRSDPKSGNPSRWSRGRGPQGDEIRILNHVRCVRGGAAKLTEKPPDSDIGEIPQSFMPNPSAGGPQRRGPGADRFIRRLDLDNDGKVSQMEFDGPDIHFHQMDKNRDGFLSEDEAPKGPPARRRGSPGPGGPRGFQ